MICMICKNEVSENSVICYVCGAMPWKSPDMFLNEEQRQIWLENIYNPQLEHWRKMQSIIEENDKLVQELQKNNKSLNDEISNLKAEIENLKLKNQKTSKLNIYNDLNVGDEFKLGKFEGKDIKWVVLKKSADTMYVISKDILCKKAWSKNNSNDWYKSDIRKWLNNEFYDVAFNTEEKNHIGDVEVDRITLLTKEEAEQLLDQKSRAKGKGTWWWLRSSYPNHSDYVWDVYSDGDIIYSSARISGGVRPAFNLK